jgi:hypothetical protein
MYQKFVPTVNDGNAKGVAMNKKAYSYSVLRYVHDVTTGEFVNVGLALYCPDMLYANATCRTSSKRLTTFFPSLDGSLFHSLMRKVQTRFETIHDEVRHQLALRSYASVMELAHSVIPKDDSTLQWAPMGSGLTSDPDATLEQLFERFVMKHEEIGTVHHRNDEASEDNQRSINSEAIASLETELPVGKTSALTHLDKAKAIRDSLATREFNPDDIEQFKRSGRS